MACGCALVAAANDGVRDFAENGRTAVLAPIGDAAALADGLVDLLTDAPRREQLAESGIEAIRAFDWERSVERLESVLSSRVGS
jgi:glycosyltransferase involved in cell wall biosynthesis